MTLPPTIPTSFVPHSATAPRRYRADFTNAFGFAMYAIVAVAFILALGVFVYGRMLASTQATKDAKLANAVNEIDSTTVENFVRLRDRLSEGQKLLNEHAAFTNFFSLLEKVLPASVRFESIHLSFGVDGVPKLEGSGVAKSFNSLAFASTAFAQDGHIKGAIFSNISINKDSSVSFELLATLDPKVITFSPSAPAPSAGSGQAASTTPPL
ncbi:MAG: hypothetical protein Q8P16_02390 [bacterium]|nr:hypothetical protein [bacterium]